MRKQFSITGLFYEISGYKCRKYLNIRNSDYDCQIPDLMVIMMNPGKSKPIDGIDNNHKESIAIPDQTQDQIMKVMKNCDFHFARILNLSDLREPKSGIFYEKLVDLKLEKVTHSIFDKNRNKDFKELFINNVPIIYAWGVNKDLFELAKTAMNRINAKNPIGINKEGNEYAYYHPLPWNSDKQKEWVEKITMRIKTA